MILIADSGSTKAHWCLMAANGHTSEYYTDGVNPIFQTVEQMKAVLLDQLLPQMAKQLWAGTITRVFFYGAGCTPEKSPLAKQAIEAVFHKAEAEVASDMLGAARGLLGTARGVACILGTGSNSCLYDGERIVWNVPALGFILGDEGSGAVLGRRLISDLLKNQLGEDLKQKFLSQYHLTQADIIEHVYRLPMPNRWLAQFAPFCSENIEDKRIYNLVYNHLSSFIVRNVRQYYAAEQTAHIGNDPYECVDLAALPVGFVGSIAYYFRPVLEQVLHDNGLPAAAILKDPISGLITFHRKDALPTM